MYQKSETWRIDHGVRYRGVQGVHGPPKNKLGGPVIGLDPPTFLKNLKILFENIRINNSFKNSSKVLSWSQNIFLNLAITFYILRINLFINLHRIFEYFDF